MERYWMQSIKAMIRLDCCCCFASLRFRLTPELIKRWNKGKIRKEKLSGTLYGILFNFVKSTLQTKINDIFRARSNNIQCNHIVIYLIHKFCLCALAFITPSLWKEKKLICFNSWNTSLIGINLHCMDKAILIKLVLITRNIWYLYVVLFTSYHLICCCFVIEIIS